MKICHKIAEFRSKIQHLKRQSYRMLTYIKLLVGIARGSVHPPRDPNQQFDIFIIIVIYLKIY